MSDKKSHVFFVESPLDECLVVWENSKKEAEKSAKKALGKVKFRYAPELSKEAASSKNLLKTIPPEKECPQRVERLALLSLIEDKGNDKAQNASTETKAIDWYKPQASGRLGFVAPDDGQADAFAHLSPKERKALDKTGLKLVYQGPYGEALIGYNSRVGKWEAVLMAEGSSQHNYTVQLKAYNEELAKQEAVALLRDEGQRNYMLSRRPTREEAMEAIRTLLAYTGDNPNREGLIGTPDRVVRAYEEFFGGYQQSSWNALKTSFSESGSYNEMVVLTDIDFDSHCEHHMVPFTGVAHIAYFPDKTVVGISKLARLVEIYARRLQIQEKMTAQIADNLQINLQPKGVAVVIVGQHMCMTTRGVKKKRVKMVTSTMTGVFQDDAKIRSEFLNLIGNPKGGMEN